MLDTQTMFLDLWNGNSEWLIFPIAFMFCYCLAGMIAIVFVLIFDIKNGYFDFLGTRLAFQRKDVRYMAIAMIPMILILIPTFLIILPDRITNHYLQEFGLKTEKQVKVKNHRELPSTMKDSPLLKD